MRVGSVKGLIVFCVGREQSPSLAPILGGKGISVLVPSQNNEMTARKMYMAIHHRMKAHANSLKQDVCALNHLLNYLTALSF